MSGATQPSEPGASPSSSAKRPNQDWFYWNKLPSIRILIPPKGAHSYKTDERCFTYCSQSARGRAQGQEPWCRSICIRKVFPHEVRKVMRIVESTPQGLMEKEVEGDTRVPLPPEGQRLPSWLTGKQRVGDSGADDTEVDDLDDYDPMGNKGWKNIVNDVQHESQAIRSGAKAQETDPEVWKAGWYVWLTKNKWAVQEKMDGMMTDLERQAEWARMKHDVNQEWERAQQMAAVSPVSGDGHPPHEENHSQPESHPESHPESPSQGHGDTAPSATNVTFVSEDSLPTLPNPPFPDTTSSTLLVPIPLPLPPINTYLANLLAPTNKVMKLTHESLASGSQFKFAGMLWEKAKSDQPYVLARNVTRKIWRVWTGGEEDDGEGRRKER
ncbi:uncharacterized protein PHACADRAFT_259849 [Phanerochaete carnosa HHB-10118-sp]|uniref:Uncharacterized protein n=1 Tax=Phanerochaete carnosa (strain HHB-10118-sp) TaxID=650164 RepID=K5VPS2_PHACS|nr:uncharacterized protein PHACADRAFT_259849 [Phanerochaete carnosa HHB-10118-sp]EKM53453.1 hypothetical protein PHACADRAFT_259849 [Phanerochaete carnosa HHB-10118-sp]